MIRHPGADRDRPNIDRRRTPSQARLARTFIAQYWDANERALLLLLRTPTSSRLTRAQRCGQSDSEKVRLFMRDRRWTSAYKGKLGTHMGVSAA